MDMSPQLADILAKATAMYGQPQFESLHRPQDHGHWASKMVRATLAFVSQKRFVQALLPLRNWKTRS